MGVNMKLVERIKKLDNETKAAIYVPCLFVFWWLMGAGVGATCGG
jgi:hypothetical protein